MMDILDFISKNLGNILTIITAVTTAFLAVSDLNRRKAETAAKQAEAHKIDTDAADKITESALKMLEPKDKQIVQQDSQIKRLLEENAQISSKFNEFQIEFNKLKESVAARDVQDQKLANERREWEKGISILLNQLVKAKIVPLWLPDGVTVSEIEIEPKLIISGFGTK